MDELLKRYSIDEISEKTSISPSVLKKIVNGEFEKLDKLRFKGFLKILQEEFKDIDFSELEEKANSFYFIKDDSKKTEKNQIVEKLDKENEKNYKNYIFVVALIVVIGILLYYMNNNKKGRGENNSSNLESLKVEKIVEKNETNISNANENNLRDKNNSTLNEINITKNIIEKNVTEENKTELQDSDKNSSKKAIDKILRIEPLKLVWFKVYYLDSTKKSKEYYTSKPVELNGTRNLFIKFGHGMIKLDYNGTIITPNTKKVTRIILKDGELNITKKRLKSFR